MSTIKKDNPKSRIQRGISSVRTENTEISINIEIGTPIGLLLVLTYPERQTIKKEKTEIPINKIKKN